MNERDIFLEALEQRDPAERTAFLDRVCGDNRALRERVEELLREQEKLGSFLERPAEGIAETGAFHSPPEEERAPVSPEGPGTVIGPYKLIEEIGEGGMGTVYMAQQTRPVKRLVALKLISPGMDSRQVIARFEAERQALALMDHPNIARVFDAGSTDSGRPYFVMELVKGVPLTQYCDAHRLTPKERLELFVPVCQAIQHAHQKGIIHRDIKPSNVLVALYDGKPVPKVIDFGVAKATGQQLTEHTLVTGFGSVVGTLEYMSPEQAEVNQLDIDTRSDIYSLGVLLYELLTGSTPLERKRLKQAALLEVLRLIREEEPPRPSTRLSDSKDSLPSVSAQRNTEPAKLSKLVRGELDWIVMKALEKDRNRRYETANAFAADVQRYLHDEQVLACPPSASYRLRKFVRRNKGPVSAVSLVALALVAGIVGTTIGFFQAKQAQKREAERADGERQAKQEAEAKEAETRAVLDFVENKIFAAARPEGQGGGLGIEVTLRKAIDAALPFVENSFTDQPLIEARLRLTLGVSLLYLGEAKKAEEQFEKARSIRTKHLGPDHPLTLRSMLCLQDSYGHLGRFAEAMKLAEETLALAKTKLGSTHDYTLRSMGNLASSYANLGRHAEALKLREEALALWKANFGPSHPETLASMSNLASSYNHLGRHRDAAKLLEETLALKKIKLGADHPSTLQTMHNLAWSYDGLRRHADALKLNQETLELRKIKLGPDHPGTLLTMNNLGCSYECLGRHAEALKVRQETLALEKIKFGPDHPETIRSISNVASSYYALGRYAEALKLHQETLALRKAKLGPRHPDTLRSMGNLAETLFKVDRSAEAVPIIDECLQLAAGKAIHRLVIDKVLRLRVRHFQSAKDVAGCRATAEMREQLHLTNAAGLYNAACARAVTAAVLRATDQSAAKEANAETDRAMAWLKQAVAAGYSNVKHMKKDTDLDSLRDRDDFKRLLSELEAKKSKEIKR